MSFILTAQVFNIADLATGPRMVLAFLADSANPVGRSWPSVQKIANRCGMSCRSAQRHLATLKNLGFLQRFYRQGRSSITRIADFTHLLIKPTLVVPDFLPDELSPTYANLSPPPTPNWHREPAIEPIKEITAAVVAEPAITANAALVSQFEESPELPMAEALRLGLAIQGLQRGSSTGSAGVVSLEFEEGNLAITRQIGGEHQFVGHYEIKNLADALGETCKTVAKAAAEKATSGFDDGDDPALPGLMADFGVIRKSKKKAARMTNTEAVVFADEAKKAGLTVAQALKTCILRGWSRLEASWLPAAPTDAAVAAPAVYVHPVAVPATQSIIAVGKASLAALRAKICSPAPQAGNPQTNWATVAVEKRRAGGYVSSSALRSACDVLGLDYKSLIGR